MKKILEAVCHRIGNLNDQYYQTAIYTKIPVRCYFKPKTMVKKKRKY